MLQADVASYFNDPFSIHGFFFHSVRIYKEKFVAIFLIQNVYKRKGRINTNN